MQSICDVAAASFQQPELNMKEAEHFAQALDQAELRAFDDKLGPHDEAAQLTPPELKSMQSQLPPTHGASGEAQPAGGLEAKPG